MIVGKSDGVRIDNSDRLANIRYVQSSNIDWIGWPQKGEPLMLVRFKNREIYGYIGVSRQRAMAVALAPSPGKFLNTRIKPEFKAVHINQW